MSLKAYVASTDYGDTQEIVFAKRAQDVKKMGLDVWSDCDFVERRVKRAPSFDDASNPPTSQEYLDRGWWLYCSDCNQIVYGNETDHLTVERFAFCNRDCLKAFAQSCVEHKWDFPAVIEAARKSSDCGESLKEKRDDG